MTQTSLARTAPDGAREAGTSGSAVVVFGPAVPDWLREWSRHTGRRLEPCPQVRAPSLVGGPAEDDLTGRTVWVARGVADRDPQHIVVAIRRLPDDNPVLVEAVSAAEFLDAALVIAHAVPVSFAERSVGLDAAVAEGHRLLAAAGDAATRRLPVSRVDRVLVRSHPHELVGEALDADLLVMGGPHDEQPSAPGLVRGSALRHAPCPVLLVPRHLHGGRPAVLGSDA